MKPSSSMFPRNFAGNFQFCLFVAPLHLNLLAVRSNKLSQVQDFVLCAAGTNAGRKHSAISTKWLLIIILMPAVLLVWSIVLFLLWTCKGKQPTPSSLGMLVWTNQSTLQHHLDADLSSESSSTLSLLPSSLPP